ncbi:hypothetical protein GUJ93_ZPchr0010g10961 [Zizania palustris]|uniref:Uncharacterized protein n=1 Tax=Zizania palustris TaxID=103762 RepID=A0A8J6BFH2_ZIZPA|nr:hypothetical protein GUJ93_ZPchr0010g10961 [Zizania palustris]
MSPRRSRASARSPACARVREEESIVYMPDVASSHCNTMIDSNLSAGGVKVSGAMAEWASSDWKSRT